LGHKILPAPPVLFLIDLWIDRKAAGSGHGSLLVGFERFQNRGNMVRNQPQKKNLTDF